MCWCLFVAPYRAILLDMARQSLQRVDSYARTLPGEGLGGAFSPEDEDYMSPEERAASVALFRRAVLHPEGSEGYRRYVPADTAWTPSEVAWAAVGAALLGLAAGWVWRRRREQRAQRAQPGMLGLDLLGAQS